MRIAYVGYGSLIQRPRELPTRGDWQVGGPSLPVEFSRIAKDGRLTLVVDPVAGARVPTRFIESGAPELDEAIRGLAERESTHPRHIGFFDATTGRHARSQHPDQPDVVEILREFAREREFDAMVWTALPANFAEKREMPFSIESALAYLAPLGGETRRLALRYLAEAPPEVDTPLRRAARADARFAAEIAQHWPW